MTTLYILFEHATGYALFQTYEFEEIALFLPQVQSSILDVAKFRSLVHLIAFQSFEDGKVALENMKSISQSIMTKDLQLFLDNSVPKTKKKKKTVLGVQDPQLGEAISKTLGITCSTSGVISEIIRGIRIHFHKLVKGFKDLNTANKAQLALGHNFSRHKVNFDVKRFDNLIIQSLDLVEQLEKDIATLTARIRGWYSYHFPELAKLVSDNVDFVRCVQVICDRKNLPENVEDQLKNILNNNILVRDVLEAAHKSMGMDISSVDVDNIKNVISRILSLHDRQQKTTEYLKVKMQQVAPSLSHLVGEVVGAQLISRAGGLPNLAKLTSSAILVLGAQKALFRHLKKPGCNPKLGFIVDSAIIKSAGKKSKSRLSRFLANKCTLAARIDYFRKNTSENYGHVLWQQVEDRMDFIERCSSKKEHTTVEANEVGHIDNKQKEEMEVTGNDVDQEDRNLATSPVVSEAELSVESVTKKKRKSNEKLSLDFSDEEESEDEVKEVKKSKKSLRLQKKRKLLKMSEKNDG